MSIYSDLISVVEHLVKTHPTFNASMTRVDAEAKIAAAKLADQAHSALHQVEYQDKADVSEDVHQVMQTIASETTNG